MKIQFLIEGDQSSDAISIFRCDFEAGARGPMPHSHDAFDETVYGLSGEDGDPEAARHNSRTARRLTEESRRGLPDRFIA
jgi:hypothetical protein